jgi:lipopolysaccharide export LptBFGC system permease protein LptF
MTQPYEEWWRRPRRYVGLLLMGLGVLIGVVSGVLAFERVITVEIAYGAMAISLFLLGLPGFVLHMVTVARIRKSNGA